jgi:osmotically-inducible protein OsmY
MFQQNKREKFYFRVPAILSSVLLLGVFAMPATSKAQQRQEPQSQRQRPAPQRNQTLLQMHSDDMIRDLIVMRLGDRWSFYPNMKVTVDQGVATLTGKVPSEAIENRALRIARRTPAVDSVRDQLDVDAAARKTEKPAIGQADLAKAVAQKIAANITGTKAGKDWWFDGWRVEGRDNTWNLIVEVPEPGRVVLEGELPQLDLVRRAIESAVEVAGVRSLNSNLQLDPDFYNDNRSFPYYPYAYPFAYYPFYPYALGSYGPYAARPQER